MKFAFTSLARRRFSTLPPSLGYLDLLKEVKNDPLEGEIGRITAFRIILVGLGQFAGSLCSSFSTLLLQCLSDLRIVFFCFINRNSFVKMNDILRLEFKISQIVSHDCEKSSSTNLIFVKFASINAFIILSLSLTDLPNTVDTFSPWTSRNFFLA